MTLEIANDPVPLKIDQDGTVRVGGTRVTLDVMLAGFDQGEAPEEIVSAFPTLKLADVYLVIGYYLRHRDEVDAYLAVQRRQADELRAKIESDPAQRAFRDGLRERLLARQEKAQHAPDDSAGR
jgi:uncharacterized protein (DUF433 family)